MLLLNLWSNPELLILPKRILANCRYNSKFPLTTASSSSTSSTTPSTSELSSLECDNPQVGIISENHPVVIVSTADELFF